MIRIVKNTFPKYKDIPTAEPGDLCNWVYINSTINLIRISDGKFIFGIMDIDENGLYRDNKKRPKLTGIISEVKKRNWVLEVEEIGDQSHE